MLLFIFSQKTRLIDISIYKAFYKREGEIVKSIKERGLKEDSKGFIIYLIFIFVLAFFISLLIPDVRHHLSLWLNNIFSNFDLAVDSKTIENSETSLRFHYSNTYKGGAEMHTPEDNAPYPPIKW